MAKQKKPAAIASKSPKVAKKSAAKESPELYTMAVYLTGGLITEAFVKKNPQISRTIQIRGDQTLEELHEAIFHAYGRYDGHMYEFQFGKRPMQGPRYVLSAAMDYSDEPPAGLVEKTPIESLGLKKGRVFAYWFDFGDDWMHEIEVEAVEPVIPPGKYPKVIKRVGKSPPQYPIMDE